MACERGLNRNLCSFKIANLSNHDHVGILPQDGPQGFGEIQIDFGIHLRLAHTSQLVFNRVFYRHDVAARCV